MIAEIANAMNVLGLLACVVVCFRWGKAEAARCDALESVVRQLRAENAAYARTIVRWVLRGRGGPA